MSESPPLSSLSIVEFLDRFPEMAFVYRDDGLLVALNETCVRMLGIPRELMVDNFNLFASESIIGETLIAAYKAAFAGEVRVVEPTKIELHIKSEALEHRDVVRWVETTLIPLARRADGSACFVLGLQRDVTERVQAAGELEAHRSELASKQATIDSLEAAQREIEAQRATIEALSTPVIEVWEGVLTLPLLGHFNSERTSRMTSRVLDAVSRGGARHVILDLTGIAVFDASVAANLLGVVSAIRLLGATGVLVGIRPDVAAVMVEVGVEFASVPMYQNLRQALRACL